MRDGTVAASFRYCCTDKKLVALHAFLLGSHAPRDLLVLASAVPSLSDRKIVACGKMF